MHIKPLITYRGVEELGLSRLFWKQEYVGSNPTVATRVGEMG